VDPGSSLDGFRRNKNSIETKLGHSVSGEKHFSQGRKVTTSCPWEKKSTIQGTFPVGKKGVKSKIEREKWGNLISMTVSTRLENKAKVGGEGWVK